jgi:hypothetical protein
MFFFRMGLKVIPIVAGSKKTSVKWNPWLAHFSGQAVNAHWLAHPGDELGFIVGPRVVVFDTDAPAAMEALIALQLRFALTSPMVVRTKKGAHTYYRLGAGVFAKTDVHSTALNPDRIDVKTGRTMVVLPPSSGRTVQVMNVKHARELPEVSQDFIDAVFVHNGRQPPRPPINTCTNPSCPGNGKFKLLAAILLRLPAKCSYDEWFRVGAAVFNETRGSNDGFELFEIWSSSGGTQYGGTATTRKLWNSYKLDHSRPITIASLRLMVEALGHDWDSICDSAQEQFESLDDQAQEGI